MKTVKILLLILVIFLPFSGKSQTISIDNQKISFDSAAAVNLWQDIEVRESIIQLFQDELEKRDSTLNSATHKLFATNDSLQFMKRKYNVDIAQEKKEKQTWKGFTFGLGALAVLIAIF